MLMRIISELKSGKTVVVHCMGGLGRTGTVVACVLEILNPQTNPTEIIQVTLFSDFSYFFQAYKNREKRSNSKLQANLFCTRF
jgi:protein-tyrosine phosphatase